MKAYQERHICPHAGKAVAEFGLNTGDTWRQPVAQHQSVVGSTVEGLHPSSVRKGVGKSVKLLHPSRCNKTAGPVATTAAPAAAAAIKQATARHNQAAAAVQSLRRRPPVLAASSSEFSCNLSPAPCAGFESSAKPAQGATGLTGAGRPACERQDKYIVGSRTARGIPQLLGQSGLSWSARIVLGGAKSS